MLFIKDLITQAPFLGWGKPSWSYIYLYGRLVYVDFLPERILIPRGCRAEGNSNRR